MIDLQIIKAIEISLVFFGVMLSIVAVGLAFLKCKTSKGKAKEFLKMAGLITAWAIYMTLNLQLSAENLYSPKFFICSTAHLVSIFVGSIIIIMFLFMLPNFWKKRIFDRKLLVLAGIFAVLSILMGLIFLFFKNPYLGLLNRIVMIIPPIMGFFMIIQSSTGKRKGVVTKMIKSLYVVLAGLMLILLFSFGFSSNMTGEVISNKITGQIISEGELEGLEVGVFVPEKYQQVQAGEMLQFQISLKNIEKAGRHDIQLDYYIKKNEITISHRRELKAVETQASFLASIKVPEETLPGIYNIEVEINEEESSMATFYVKSSEVGQIRAYLIILIIAIVLVGGMISWQLHKLTKRR